jgi:uncharacterized protein (TIGR03067 family)
MMRLCGVLLAAGGLLALAPDDKKDAAAKEELKKFAGTWTVVSAETDGKKAPEDAVKGIKVVVEGDKVTIYDRDRVAGVSTLTVDPTKKPKTLDATATMGPNKGKTALAIYEFDGDTLKICLSDDKERPTEFATKEGSKAVLYVYKREKK